MDCWGLAYDIEGCVEMKLMALADPVVSLTGSEHAFAGWTVSGRVFAFGAEQNGGLIPAEVELVLSSAGRRSKVKGVVASSAAFSVWYDGGEVYCWGNAKFGGEMKKNHDQYPAGFIGNVERVFASKAAFAAKRYDGKVIVWGSCYYGGCLPEKKLWLSDIAFVIATPYVFLGFSTKHSRQLIGWGHPMFGGKEASQMGEKIAEAGDRVDWVATTIDGRVAVLTEQGRVYSWGKSIAGGDSEEVLSSLEANITALYHTDYAFAATNVAGDIIVWGNAKAGGSFTYKTASPVHIQKQVHVTSLVSTCSAFAGLTVNQSLIVWGNPYEGGRFPESAGTSSSLLIQHTNIQSIQGNEIAFLATTASTMDNNTAANDYLLWGNQQLVFGLL